MTEKETMSVVTSGKRTHFKMSPERKLQKLVKEYFHIKKLLREKSTLFSQEDLCKKNEEIIQCDDDTIRTVIRSEDSHPACKKFLSIVLFRKISLEEKKKKKKDDDKLQAIVDKDPEIIKQRREADSRSPEEKARIPDTFYAWGFFMGGGSDLCIRTKGVWFHGEPTLWHYSKFQ